MALSPTQFLLQVIFPAGRTIRSGWEDREVKSRLESVLEHGSSLGLAGVYVNLLHGLGLSNEKLLGIAFVHDLHEPHTHDPSPFRLYYVGSKRIDKVSFFERLTDFVDGWRDWEVRFRDSDRQAMWEITNPMAPAVRRLFRRWWRWYHGRRTPEAKLLNQLHALADGAKGIDYLSAKENEGMHSIDSFFEQAEETVKSPLLRPYIEEQQRLKEVISAHN